MTTARRIVIRSSDLGLPEDTRLGDAGISRDLGVVWPAVSARLHRALRRDGLTVDDAADVCQEVVVRVIEHDVPFTSADDLFPWALVAARRVAIDRFRKAQRLDSGEIPELVGPVTAEYEALQRLALRAVADAVAALPDVDRAVLGVGAAPAAGSPGYQAVRRHRLRQKLLKIKEGFGVIVWRIRRLFADAPDGAAVACVATAAALATAVIGVAVREGPPAVVVAVAAVASGPPPVAGSAPSSEPGANGGSAEQPRLRQELQQPLGAPRRRDYLPVHPSVSVPVPTPAPTQVHVTPTPQDSSLVCVHNLRVVASTCVGEPLDPALP